MITESIYKLRTKYPMGYITIQAIFECEHGCHVESRWELYIQGKPEAEIFGTLAELMDYVDLVYIKNPLMFSEVIKNDNA